LEIWRGYVGGVWGLNSPLGGLSPRKPPLSSPLQPTSSTTMRYYIACQWLGVDVCRPTFGHAWVLLCNRTGCLELRNPVCYTDIYLQTVITRKSRYRKDDRAMHPIYECPENCM